MRITIPNMNSLKLRILTLCLSFIPFYLYAQNDTASMVKYSPDYRFKDGIFLNFEQVKNNNPLHKSLVVTSVSYDDPDFFNNLLEKNGELQIFDELGNVHSVDVKNIWGYSQNGVLHINLNDGFFRITIIGNICHFVASITTYRDYYNPYSPYSGYYNYPYGYYNPYSTNSTTEVRQYLLNFTTGEVFNYTVQNVELLLMSDPELHDEFVSLKKREKDQRKFMYIRMFNERNPLYFPIN